MQFQRPVAFAAFLFGAAALSFSADAQVTFTLQTIDSTGTNISPATAQFIDLSDATNGPLFGAALTAFNAKNSDTVRQDATSFMSGGQAVSPQFFPFGGPSIPVAAQVDVVGHLTANGTPGATNYFNFAETAGAFIDLNAKSTSPKFQATELRLYDNNGRYIDIGDANGTDGRSANIEFGVPVGGGGTWQTAITQGLDYPSAADYLLQFAMPTTYRSVSPFTTHVIGSGQEKNGSLGTYDVNVNIGDFLSFDLHPSTPAAEMMLRLYDGRGELVAIAFDNAPVGDDSVIDFVVPGAHGDVGQWQVVVSPVPFETLLPAFSYDLTIQGFSGLGPVNPTPVPESGAWTLLLLGFGGIAAAGRLKRKTANGALGSSR